MTGFVLFGLVFAAAVVLKVSNETLREGADDAARACGMIALRNGELSMFIGGFEARLGKVANMTVLHYNLKPLLTSAVSLRAVVFSSDRTDSTGIEAFDNTLRFEGKGAIACAYLGPRAGDVVQMIHIERAKIEHGVLTVSVAFPPTRERIRETLDQLKVFAQGLVSDGANIQRRLLRVVAYEEREPRARQRALEHLVRDYSESPEAEEALRIASGSQHSELRFAAAVLGKNAALMETFIKDEALGLSPRTAMLTHLEATAGLTKTIQVLRELVISPSAEMSVVAIERLGKRGDFGSAPRMISLVASASHRRRLALLRALVSLADAASERPLRELLPQLDDDEAGVAAQVLGKIGTVDAIADLHAAREKLGLLAAQPKREIDLAILRIKSRLEGASAGQISLNDDTVGAISVKPS